MDDAVTAACAHPRGAELGCDPVALAAIARGALAFPSGPSSLDPLFRILVESVTSVAAAVSTPSLPNAATVAAAAALLSRPDGGDIPTSVLAAWAEGGGPVAPLAARALPTRDEEDLRARVKGLLQGTDATIRAHAALGLGRDPEPSAVSLLTNAYAYEEDRSVRRALMRGLSCRHEPQRIATLTLASQLDPDDEVARLPAGR